MLLGRTSGQGYHGYIFMFELLAPAISVAANGLLIWSGFRAWRIENRFLKWSGAGLAALF
jgi:hypothetical protein